MGDLLAGVDEIVTDLKTLQLDGRPLRVVTELERVEPPCVWVAIDSIDYESGVDEVTLRLFLIAGDLSEYRAIKALSPMHDAVRTIVSPTEATTVVGVSPTFQAKPLPALRLSTTVLTT